MAGLPSYQSATSTNPPEAFRLLMSWPARLRKFTFLGCNQYSPAVEVPDIATVWSCLVPHKQSLEYVRIGSLPTYWVPGPSYMPPRVNFSVFKSLTFLSLSYWVTGSDPGEVNLLAPCLQTFRWTFDPDDDRHTYLYYFGEPEVNFLRRFARAAESRKLPLCNIIISYSPNHTINVAGQGDESLGVLETALQYPWDRMDQLAQEIQPWGIKLAYNRPSMSRIRYEGAVDSFRRYKRRRM